MLNVFTLQWKRLLKQPLLVLLFIGLTILFVYFIGRAQVNAPVTVPVYTEELSQAELEGWIDRLNEDEEGFVFEETDAEQAEEDIRMNQISFAMEVAEDNYRFLVGRQSEYLPAVDQYVRQVFLEENRLDQVREEFPDSDVEIKEFISVSSRELAQTSELVNQHQIHIMIGMTLYFTMYTVFFLQTNLVEEKRMGTWNRLIFSPLSKTQIYLGHLAHYYLVGLVQIGLSFFILTRLLSIDLGGNYVSVIVLLLAFLFAAVSLGIFLAAAVPSTQSLQVVIPIVATAMAMLGGAFWPLEAVTNRFILFLGELTPLKHALEGIVDAVQYNLPVADLLHPIGILLLMGVLCMGIGINLMERMSKV